MRTRTVHVHHRSKSRRSSNPFGVNASPKQMTEIAVGAILGGGGVKALSTMAQSSITELQGNAPLTILADAIITAALSFGVSKIPGGSNFAFGVAIGGAVVTIDAVVNAFAPSIYSAIPGGGLSGMGDLVPGRLLLPYNPFATSANMASMGVPATTPAYPGKYSRAA